MQVLDAVPMAETAESATPRAKSLSPHERLIALGATAVGPADEFASDIHALIQRTPLFESLDVAQARRLSSFMSVYEIGAGVTIIREGETGDFMLLLMQGMVDVLRRNRFNYPARIAVAHAGQAVGEMSMFDGEPRFASCVTLEPCRIAVLDRQALQRLLDEDAALSNRILLRLVQLLSERLRHTSARLVSYLEAAQDV